jgi:hypothetical protein
MNSYLSSYHYINVLDAQKYIAELGRRCRTLTNTPRLLKQLVYYIDCIMKHCSHLRDNLVQEREHIRELFRGISDKKSLDYSVW